MTATIIAMRDARDQMLVNAETVELIPCGLESLSELADKAREILDRYERDAWELGRIASSARARCESSGCGVLGPNPDARYGRWVCINFVDTHRNTLLNARRLWEVFGWRREEVSFIPQSGLYMLAEPRCDSERESVIEELKSAKSRVRVKDVADSVKRITSTAKQIRDGIEPILRDDGCTVDDLESLALAGSRFGCIYADPPWRYGNQGTRAATGNHYNGMTVDEIADLPIRDIAAENAHLHLWTTNAFLFESMQIIESWGFTYKSCFVWVKPNIGLGNYWRVAHEFMLFGVRGDCPFKSRSERSWAEYPRTIHSAKPEEVREKIEAVSNGPFLELFGRRAIAGWTVWGNQIHRDRMEYAEAVNG
jgi:N6-adenosine-specific RNA methylase IME4